MQGGAEAKRRRCDDKESLPSHSYVCIPVSLCIFMIVNLHLVLIMDDSDSYTSQAMLTHPYTYTFYFLSDEKSRKTVLIKCFSLAFLFVKL